MNAKEVSAVAALTVLGIRVVEIRNVQWCSKENQNDTIYEVNYLFLT